MAGPETTRDPLRKRLNMDAPSNTLQELADDPISRTFPDGTASICATAIIGAGFSGTMAAIHLRRRLPPAQDIHLIERTGAFARGIAYADTGAAHLLNVRAANMSAFADDPQHFERWLDANAAECAGEIHRTPAGIFATRRLYGSYLQATLHAEIAASGGTVRLLADEVQTLTQASGSWQLNCRSGKQITASSVVLASGNLPAERPHDGIEFRDPWTPDALAGLRPDAPVLIVGTGLTMVDITLAMRAQGFSGPIITLSRRGLVPHRHAASGAAWPTPEFSVLERGSAPALLHAIRAQIREAAARDIGWRAVIDSLRPITASLWCGLPQPERARFLRHLRPYWDIHRHRMAPPAAEQFQNLRSTGALHVARGRLLDVSHGDGLASVTYNNRDTGTPETIVVQRVIYATGLQGARADTGLVAALLANGQARLDRQELGLEVTPTLNLVDASGQPVPHLWALGPIVRGVFWECLAVPDIRIQADQLGREIADALATA